MTRFAKLSSSESMMEGIDFSEKELLIFNKISEAAGSLNQPVYLIGGFVRDRVLRRKTKDADIVCVGDGIALAHRTASLFDPVPHVAYYKNYGTAQFKIGDFEIEFVGTRKESYQRDSRNPSVEPGTLTDDQNRRDFTINTLAISLNPEDFGDLVDPFGGLAHIAEKKIITPHDPDKTFDDDPLRMMRAIRFASQLQFTIAEETLSSIARNASRIKIITQERITTELNKIILSEKPSIGFELLYRVGLLEIIFPLMTDLAGAEFIEGMGHKDNFFHTLQVLDNISRETDDLWLRWAAILHDIGKPATKRFEAGHGFTFHGHEVVGSRMVPGIFSRLKLPLNEKMRYVKKLVELHLRPISLSKEDITDSAMRRLLFDAGDCLEDLMTLCEADITSKNRQKVKRFLANFELVRKRLKEVEESDHIRNWQPPVTGEMIMETFGLQPGREVGIIKTAIREAILNGEIENNYEKGFAYMLDKGKELNLTPVNQPKQ